MSLFTRGLIRLLGQPSELKVGAPWLDGLMFFENQPRRGGVLVVSSGFSNNILHQSAKGFIRQELMVIQEDNFDRRLVASLLLSVSKQVADRGHAIQRGEVFGPSGPLLPGSETSALFATMPPFLPESVYLLRDEEVPLLGVWLVPISEAEAERRKQAGFTEFVDYLADIEDRDQPIWGFSRRSGR